MEDMIKWASAEGASWSPSLQVKTGSRGRGVFATAPIKEGDLLLSLPGSLAIRPPAALSELVKTNGVSALLALILTVQHNLFVSESPSPYFQDLSSSDTPPLPSSWTDADLQELAGTSLLPPPMTPAMVRATAKEAYETDVVAAMDKLPDSFLPATTRNKKDFQTALSWVCSRALQGRLNFEMGTGNLWPYLGTDGPPTATTRHGCNGMFLLPLFDLINHSTDVKKRGTELARVDGEAEGTDAWEMRATRDLAEGEEVLQSYGHHGGAELLRNYGFVEESALTKVWVGLEQVLAAVKGTGAGAGGGREEGGGGGAG
ncbi:hypothetical protein TeGR_g5452, partial [Tetraparma gracilis]